jgi:acetyl/propionyl-CoA carboxylase alpha subunit
MEPSTSIQKREIRSVLVANRGEVAIRVAKTCEEMGLRTVVIFTDSDAGAPFTKVGQNAVHIGEDRNYINIPVVVAAAKKAGVDAIHPGYGFLAESAPFAAAVADAGLIFIGPSSKTISELGSKIGAKRLLSEKAPEVPLIPGFYPAKGEPEPATPQEWLAKAKAIGYPVLIKAAAGGGGKGMRVVREEKEFLESLDSAKTEAKGAFGDESVMLERYFETFVTSKSRFSAMRTGTWITSTNASAPFRGDTKSC